MKINLTKKQYEKMVQLLFYGNWMADTILSDTEEGKELNELEQYIHSFAKDFGFDDKIKFDPSMGMAFPTHEMEAEMHGVIDEFEDYVFWEKLAGNLAERDAKNDPRFFDLPADERFRIINELEEEYALHFEENGLSKVKIDK